MSVYIRILITLVSGISLFPLYAQQNDTLICIENSCCSSNDPTPAGVMISRLHSKKEWMFSYKLMQMSMGGLRSGTRSVPKEEAFSSYLMVPENMQMNMHMLMAMYGATNRLTLMTMLQYNTTSMHMSMFAASAHHHNGTTEQSPNHTMESSGLGDIKLYALYGILNTSHHQVLMSGGVSIPTGSVTVKGSSDNMMYPGTRMPYSMQLGSGSFDLLPCMNYLYQHNQITFSSQLAGTIRTGKNAIGYTLGNAVSSSNWVAYRWFPYISSSLRLEGIISGDIKGQDATQYLFNEPSSNPVNYGGRMLNGYLGSMFRYPKGFLSTTSLSLEYGLPLYQHVNGLQMRQQQTVYVSLQYGF